MVVVRGRRASAPSHATGVDRRRLSGTDTVAAGASASMNSSSRSAGPTGGSASGAWRQIRSGSVVAVHAPAASRCRSPVVGARTRTGPRDPGDPTGSRGGLGRGRRPTGCRDGSEGGGARARFPFSLSREPWAAVQPGPGGSISQGPPGPVDRTTPAEAGTPHWRPSVAAINSREAGWPRESARFSVCKQWQDTAPIPGQEGRGAAPHSGSSALLRRVPIRRQWAVSLTVSKHTPAAAPSSAAPGGGGDA